MNLLTDRLTRSVFLGDIEYPIAWDFRAGIKLELLLDDPDVSDADKKSSALKLFYGVARWEEAQIKQNPVPYLNFIDHVQEAITQLLEFYIGPEKSGVQGGSGGKGQQERIYSFNDDASRIYASFFQQYHIDLSKVKLHWWKFKALFEGLSEETSMRKVMDIRSLSDSEISRMPKEQAAMYRQLKKRCALSPRLSKSEREKQAALEDILMHGGSLAEIQ